MNVTVAAVVDIVDRRFETTVTLAFEGAEGLYRVSLPVTSGWTAPVISDDGVLVTAASAVRWYVGDAEGGENTSGTLTAELTQ